MNNINKQNNNTTNNEELEFPGLLNKLTILHLLLKTGYPAIQIKLIEFIIISHSCSPVTAIHIFPPNCYKTDKC